MVPDMGGQVNLAGTVRLDVGLDELLPQATDVIGIVSKGVLVAGVHVCESVAVGLHSELEGLEAVVLGEVGHEGAEGVGLRCRVSEYVLQRWHPRANRGCQADGPRRSHGRITASAGADTSTKTGLGLLRRWLRRQFPRRGTGCQIGGGVASDLGSGHVSAVTNSPRGKYGDDGVTDPKLPETHSIFRKLNHPGPWKMNTGQEVAALAFAFAKRGKGSRRKTRRTHWEEAEEGDAMRTNSKARVAVEGGGWRKLEVEESNCTHECPPGPTRNEV